MAANSKTFYKNTMVFSIIAGVFTLAMLLLVIFVPASREFVYCIATVEVGLIAIVIYSIVKIVRYDKKMDKQAKAGNDFLVTIDTCPDYFVKQVNQKGIGGATSTGEVCKNGYTSPDVDGLKYYFGKRGCVGGSLSNCKIDKSDTTVNTFPIDLSDYSKKESKVICNLVNTADDEYTFTHVPWTDIKSRCNSLSLGRVLGTYKEPTPPVVPNV
jgi:hypothetical protein